MQCYFCSVRRRAAADHIRVYHTRLSGHQMLFLFLSTYICEKMTEAWNKLAASLVQTWVKETRSHRQAQPQHYFGMLYIKLLWSTQLDGPQFTVEN